MSYVDQSEVVAFGRVFDAGIQKNLRELEHVYEELHLRRFVWSQAHSRYLAAPLTPLRCEVTYRPVDALERPADAGTLRPAALLIDFACGDAWRWASDGEVWDAALAFAQAVWPDQARDGRHLSEQLCVALAARRGVRLVFEQLPNIDYVALGAITAKLDAAVAAAARPVAAPQPPPPLAPDPAAADDAVEARRALAASLDTSRPSRR